MFFFLNLLIFISTVFTQEREVERINDAEKDEGVEKDE